MRQKIISSVKRCVVKIGTSTVIKENGEFNLEFLEYLAKTAKSFQEKKIQLCVVTSGAIGAGKRALGLKRKPSRLPQIQALAAIGQIDLMHAFKECFRKYDLNVGQILLTHEVLKDRTRFLNARYSIQSLFELGCVPIINENDSVSVEEIKVGDNDTLGAYVTNLIEADLLILLSDIEGLMTEDPRVNRDAKLVPEVFAINSEIEAMAGTAGENGTGGLKTKIEAAKIVTQCGEAMIIASSRIPDILGKIMKGEKIGTIFYPVKEGLSSRKRWLALHTSSQGKLVIDDGAATAILKNGKSLLSSGILEVHGEFSERDFVDIVNQGETIAKGIVNYGYGEASRIKGLRTQEIEKKLGVCPYESMVHRDYMVIVKKEH